MSLVGAPLHGSAQIGNGMADLLAAHFNSGLVAAKLGGGERPVCGNPGTGALWRDLGFVAQRYVVKVLWYSRITSLFSQRGKKQKRRGSATWLGFSAAFWILDRFSFVYLLSWCLLVGKEAFVFKINFPVYPCMFISYFI